MIELRIDPTQWIELERRVGKAGANAPKALTRAINHTGNKAKTQMVRALADQTGLKPKTTRKALRTKQASGPGGAFVIKAAGGNIRLKFFKQKEVKGGVSAMPWNKRRVYAGAFFKGGRKGKRKDLGLHGTTLKRKGGARYPIGDIRSGLYLANEMVKGQTENVFYSVARAELPKRLMHELGFIIGKG